MVSQGKASLLYQIFGGGVEYCKVTKHGVPHKDFEAEVEYEDGECKVTVNGGDKVKYPRSTQRGQ